jgi:predicted MFS family arabinose efflux permease
VKSDSPFHYAPFRKVLVARTISTAGSWMQTVAAGWLVYHLTGSAASVGVLTLLSRGPGLVLSTYGGELADRFERRRLTAVLYAAQALPAAVLAVVAWDGISTPFEVYAATFFGGIGGALGGPVLQQIITGTVPDELAKRATGLSSVAFNAARLIGPAVGGALVAGIGPGPAFAFNAVSYFAIVIVALRLPPAAGRAPGARTHLRRGVSQARRNAVLRALFAGTILFSILVAPIQELAPAIANRHGDEAHLLGFLLSGLALGGLIGNFVRSRLEHRQAALNVMLGGSLVGCGLSLLVLAATANYAIAIGAMVACGTAWDVLFVVALTGVQLEDPRESGLMTGLFFTVMLGGVSLGALAVGGLYDVIGVDWGLALCATATVVYGLWRLAVPTPARAEAAAG